VVTLPGLAELYGERIYGAIYARTLHCEVTTTIVLILSVVAKWMRVQLWVFRLYYLCLLGSGSAAEEFCLP
jgi:hypothetical protein